MLRKFPKTGWFRLLVLSLLLGTASAAFSQTPSSTISYQGRLTDAGSPASGLFDLRFTLWDLLAAGNQVPVGTPITLTKTGVLVTNGVFTVQLDFTAASFPGADRFLEVSVKHPADVSYTTLTPRQQLTSTPYSIRSGLVPFNGVNAGTNNGALVIGAGGSLAASGGGTITATSAPANGLTGNALAVGVTGSSLTTVGTLTGLSINGTLNMTTHAITNVTTPVAATDAANKSYVDSAVATGGSPIGTIFAGRHLPNSNALSPYYLTIGAESAELNTAPCSVTSCTRVDRYMPIAGTFSFTLKVNSIGTFAQIATYTLYRNDVATALTCNIAASTNPGSCTSTGSLLIGADDRWHIRLTWPGGGVLPGSSSGFIMYTGLHIK